MWKRASEVYPDYVLFNENIDPSDIKQGQLANSAGCYLVKFYVNGLIKGVLVDDTFLFN